MIKRMYPEIAVREFIMPIHQDFEEKGFPI
jgi:hypothetical protein